MTIAIYTPDEYTFYAQKGTDSEILLAHINGGERRFYGKDSLKDIEKLAKAHGWLTLVQKVE